VTSVSLNFIRSAWLALGLLAVALPTAAAAEALVGQPAPKFKPGEFVSGTPWPARRRERRVVLIHFFRTWDRPSEAQVPHLDRLHELYDARGLDVVAVTNEDPATARAFVERTSATHPVVAEKGDSSQRFGLLTGFPTAYLIDVEGVVRWRGNWAQEGEKTIVELLRSVVLRPKLPARFTDISAAVRVEDFARAATAIASAKKRDSTTQSDRAALDRMVAWVNDAGRADLARAAPAVADKDHYATWVVYDGVRARFEGFDVADEAEQLIRRLLVDTQRLREMKGGRALAEARERIRDLTPEKAVQSLRRAMAPYRGTRAAKRAKELIAALERKPDSD
jgi:peroxiredoxin